MGYWGDGGMGEWGSRDVDGIARLHEFSLANHPIPHSPITPLPQSSKPIPPFPQSSKPALDTRGQIEYNVLS